MHVAKDQINTYTTEQEFTTIIIILTQLWGSDRFAGSVIYLMHQPTTTRREGKEEIFYSSAIDRNAMDFYKM